MRHLYVLLAMLVTTLPAAAQTVRVSANCDLYERPAVTSQTLGRLFPGNTATRIGSSGGWLHVRRNGQTGYAMATCFGGAAGGSASARSPRTSSPGTPRASSRAAAGRTYRVGPRGGCYYVNASGRRVSVSRSRCGLAPAARSAAPARSRSRSARRSYTSGSSGYITGPRGGCYYINRNGNKTYVAHSYCGR